MKKIILGALFIYGMPALSQATVYYVSNLGSDANNGQSWLTAFETLQAAMSAATTGDQVWIEKGVYKPTGNGTGRSVCFKLKNNVEVYGGFAGSESYLSERDTALLHTTNETVLTGDLLGDDVPGDTTLTVNKTDNAFRVFNHVTADALNSTAVLNGVTITGACATTGGTGGATTGGGIYNQLCSPTFIEVYIKGNIANNGGGVYVTGTTGSAAQFCIPTFTNCLISGNIANTTGGGAYCISNASPVFTNVTIAGNKSLGATTVAGAGGLYIINSSLGIQPVFVNATISNNSAVGRGGGLYIWGSSPVFKNLTVSGNSAANGGGFYITPNGTNVPHSYPKLTNALIAENSASLRGGAFYCESNGFSIITNATIVNNLAPYGSGFYDTINSPRITNSIVRNAGDNILNAGGGSPVFAFSNVWGAGGSNNWQTGYGIDSSGNLDSDPLFSTGTWFLQASSPMIDAGNDALYNSAGGNLYADTCNDGLPRMEGSAIDIGAFEHPVVLSLKAADLSAERLSGNEVSLSWKTEGTGMADLEVQRSENGIDFTTIKNIKTYRAEAYSITDKPITITGKLFYRLRMVAPGENPVYSNVASVVFSTGNDNLSIYPNPATSQITIDTRRHLDSPETVVFTNMQGRVVKTALILAGTGIDIRDLPAGVYFIKVNGFPVQRWIKQ
ncbi:MAG TPA: T9SS type A sorting domain-containing protein [Flavipsychrobacter sp.]|nr:T9SS type A sorting domain-containing protein [Flavipsychrobacter sp.]